MESDALWKVVSLIRQRTLRKGFLPKFSDTYGGWGHFLKGNLNLKGLTKLDGTHSSALQQGVGHEQGLGMRRRGDVVARGCSGAGM